MTLMNGNVSFPLVFSLCVSLFFSNPLYFNFFPVCFFYNTHTGDNFGSFGNLGMLLDSTKARVRRQKIWDVVRFDSFEINNLLDDEYEPRERHTIVKEARRMVGRELLYSVYTYNCEHFVTGLRYGKPESRQVGVLPLTKPVWSFIRWGKVQIVYAGYHK